ncbi:methyltransferase domain-containing protein [Candidatus Pacearchaeota archaeon]|nr:methyltransferase domain-containing protein [Candidatus Pacearchaeota archaeon]
MEKLNLGSGMDYRQGFVNVDIDKNAKPDFAIDIEKGLKKFKDNTFDYVYSRHVLEHLDPRKLKFVMDEISRVSKNGAIVDVYVPHFSCGKTYQSYDHLNSMSFFTFSVKDFKTFKILKRHLSFMRDELPYTGNPKLNNLAKIINPIFSFIPNKIPFIYERFFCWIYPMEEIHFRFKIIKDQI